MTTIEENNLSEPLLLAAGDGNKRAMTDCWPSTASAAAKLFVPQHWKKNNSTTTTCTLTYDTEDGLLKVITSADQVSPEVIILDVMDPKDMIGANLEIVDAQEEEEEEEDDEDARRRRRQAYRNALVEGDTSTSSNNDAVAYLNIYCYPRQQRQHDNILGWCAGAGWGVSSNDDPCGIKNNIKFPPCTAVTAPNNDDNATSAGHRQAHHRRFEVVPTMDLADIQTVVSAIRTLAAGGQRQDDDVLMQRNSKFLVLVNPQAGTKVATKVYETIVKPMLQQASMDHDVYFTESNRDAEQYMRTKSDLLQYTAYLCMGGDGVLHETIQGIKAREDADQVRKKLALGVVGCGTGNGLAKSILHASEENYSQLESVFVICKGKTVPMDLSTYQVADKTYASFLTFSWSMIADIDMESECIRCLGSSRFDVWAVWRVLNLRKYPAKLSYLSPNEDSKTKGVETMPPLNEPVPSDWKTIEGNFILFWVSQVTHAAVNTFHCPPSKMQDGLFHILLVRTPASRFRIASLLLSLEHGTHVDSPIAEFIECVAYRLEPMIEGSFNDLDGEAIESGPIQGKVEPAAIRVFCTPIAPP